MKYLTLRFDVDSHKCIKEGVPRLLKLAEETDVKFTFFVCVGRAIDQMSFLSNKFKESGEKHDNLSAFTKLGFKDYLVAAIMNPNIGVVGEGVIRECIQKGFEVGLHGGANHELWNRQIDAWSKRKIESEIKWGIDVITSIEPSYKVKSFAGPHWKGNKKVYDVLKKHSFDYVSDVHTDEPVEKISNGGELPNVPVNISGEPGGVGYLEWCRARGYSDRKILSDFSEKLKARKKFAILHDHPYYSGVKEIPLLRKMIKTAKCLNYKIVPMNAIYQKFA